MLLFKIPSDSRGHLKHMSAMSGVLASTSANPLRIGLPQSCVAAPKHAFICRREQDMQGYMLQKFIRALPHVWDSPEMEM